MTKPTPENFFTKAITYLFYILFFFTPLILWPKTSEVFEFNKMLFVYALTIIIGAAWVGRWISEKKITLRRTPLDIPIFLFLLSQILSTIFSIDTHTSLWGYYSRFHGGLISTISYIVLYYAFVSNITSSAINYILYAMLSSAALVSLYGILEHLGIDKDLWVQDVQNRVFSTLGQPNWLSAYLIALLPLPIFLALRKTSLKQSFLWLLLALLFFITILFTRSQSGISATFLILGLIALYLLVQKTKLILPLALLLFIGAAVYKWSFVEKISPLGPPNLGQLVQQDKKDRIGGSDSMLIRQVVWQGARQLGRRYPLFGTGVETFGYTYYWVRPPLHNLLSEWEFLYNKAHNEYLNMLANTGFVGLGAFLLLIVWTIAWWITALRQKPGSAIAKSLLFGYLSILITNYFGFSVVPIALFFFLFPALTLIASNYKERYISINLNINNTLGFFLLSLFTLYFLRVPYRQWQADLAYNRGKVYLARNSLKPSLDALQKAKELNPTEPLYASSLGEAQAASALAVKQQLDSLPATASGQLRSTGLQLQTDLTNQSETNSATAIAMNPYQTNYYKTKAKAELYLGMIDPQYNEKALNTLLALEKISPTDAKITYNIGLLYFQFGQKDKAREYFQKSLGLKPDYDAVTAALKQL